MTFKLHLLNNFARLHSRGEEMKHTTTHTCTQIKKHKTNHLLMGRKVLAAAAETDGSRKKRGRENNVSAVLCCEANRQRWCWLSVSLRAT